MNLFSTRVLPLVFSFLFNPALQAADSWIIPATTVPGSTTAYWSQGANQASSMIFSSANSSGQVMTTWQDDSSRLPIFSLYNAFTDTWSTPTAIPGASATSTGSGVFSTADDGGHFMATWQDQATNLPYFTIYTIATDSWSTPAEISTDPAYNGSGDFSSVTCASNHAGKYMATWQDNTTNSPFFAIYESGSWSTPATISRSGVYNGPNFTGGIVYVSGNSSYFLATWQDNMMTHFPFYGIYNILTATWTTGSISDSAFDFGPGIFSTPGDSQNFMITWKNSSRAPTFAILNGATATVTTGPTNISPADVHFYTSPFPSFAVDKYLITWEDINSNIPQYSFYDPEMATLTTPAGIPDAGAAVNLSYVFSASINNRNFIATWQNNSPTNPYYAVYGGDLPILAPSSPSGLTGFQSKNDFGLIYTLFNVLNWQPSPSVIEGYKLYRNGELIASLSPSTLTYQDLNRPKGVVTNYSVTAFSADGESTPITIAID